MSKARWARDRRMMDSVWGEEGVLEGGGGGYCSEGGGCMTSVTKT